MEKKVKVLWLNPPQDWLSWLEEGADNTKVMGLIPV